MAEEMRTELIQIGQFQRNEGDELEACLVDENQLAEGMNQICIPEGIPAILPGAFGAYNESETVNHIYDLLVRHEAYLVEWKKKLRTKAKFQKFVFPEEVKTLHQKAEYQIRKDMEIRLQSLVLPASLTTVQNNSFPVFLESIEVNEQNENFASIDGVLFSKDGRTLIRYPGCQSQEVYKIPEGVEAVAEGAFANAFLHTLVIPDTVKKWGKDCFLGCYMEQLVFAEGITSIERGVFTKCSIEKIVIPKTVRQIADYAFEDISKLREFVCDSEELSIGTGIFKNGCFKNIDWWCWSEITRAAFVNSDISKIDVPDGVVQIADYAFAGCYKAKKVQLPGSVQEVAPQSFDLGPTYNNPVKIPERLYKYAYRFPARSKINGKLKNRIWSQKAEKDFREEKDVLLRQKQSLEDLLGGTKTFQAQVRYEAKVQLDFIDRLLEESL